MVNVAGQHGFYMANKAISNNYPDATIMSNVDTDQEVCKHCSHAQHRYDENRVRMPSYCDVIGLRTAPLFYCDAWNPRNPKEWRPKSKPAPKKIEPVAVTPIDAVEEEMPTSNPSTIETTTIIQEPTTKWAAKLQRKSKTKKKGRATG